MPSPNMCTASNIVAGSPPDASTGLIFKGLPYISRGRKPHIAKNDLGAFQISHTSSKFSIFWLLLNIGAYLFFDVRPGPGEK